MEWTYYAVYRPGHTASLLRCMKHAAQDAMLQAHRTSRCALSNRMRQLEPPTDTQPMLGRTGGGQRRLRGCHCGLCGCAAQVLLQLPNAAPAHRTHQPHCANEPGIAHAQVRRKAPDSCNCSYTCTRSDWRILLRALVGCNYTGNRT